LKLIDEIEISYFRSFYKFKIRNLRDLNIIFGKNDSGKSNVMRALNLFFSGAPDHVHPFEFPIDFSEQRMKESEENEDVRKFLYVKITFNTPPSYQRSLGKKFYVKRQWTVSRGDEYHEEFSNNIPNNIKHIATRFLNKIKFIYIPAIKDVHIFEMLLENIHETIASDKPFQDAVESFSNEIHEVTKDIFGLVPSDVSVGTKISAPTRLNQLFQTLDFETTSGEGLGPKSLTRQRGDGIKARHIPELLNFISEKDTSDYHIWGFEEPENSLDFTAAQGEAGRLLSLAKRAGIQILITTHSPSFYLIDDVDTQRFYVRKAPNGASEAVFGRELEAFDKEQAMGEGFYLPAVAEALKNVATLENKAKEAEAQVGALKAELQQIATPVVLTEGRTDAKILQTAWEKLKDAPMPFSVRSCETGGENAGSGNGGAQTLSVRLKGVAGDHPHAVIGLFDYDEEGITAYKLDRNFVELTVNDIDLKRGIHGRSYAALIPAPEFRESCKKYKNLPIEYLFSDQKLLTKINGEGLKLKTKRASTKVGDEKIERELEDVTHFKDIIGNKVHFANVVVPTFDAEDFFAFEAVFAAIESAIEHNAQQN
jgi:predicted ATPase